MAAACSRRPDSTVDHSNELEANVTFTAERGSTAGSVGAVRTPAPPVLPMSADELNNRLDAWLAEAGPSLVGLRRYLHANPELSGAEFATARHVAGLLRGADLAPELLPKGNGVLCDVGPPDPQSRLVAVRADLDA